MNPGYEGFEASWHDLFWEAEEAPSELPLIKKFLEARKGRSLYIGSGSGRLLGPLAAAGHDVLGLECSSEMAKLSQENFPDAKVLEEEWQEHEGEYDAILIPAFTFQLFLDPQKQLTRLSEQANSLYLTLFFPWAEISGDLPQNEWYFDRDVVLPIGGTGELETQHKIKEQIGSLVRKHRYTMRDASGNVIRREETVQRLRFFTDAALKNLLKKSGWKIKKEIKNLGEGDDDELVYVTTLHLIALPN
ncbi:MAG: methyltransferase domain-containing protein [Akkermansiaceae bacterium]